MPDDEILDNDPVQDEPEPIPDDILQDDPGFEFNVISSNVIKVEDDGIVVSESLYIDRVRFSDKLYLIRDNELRDIVKILIKKVHDLEKKIENLNGG